KRKPRRTGITAGESLWRTSRGDSERAPFPPRQRTGAKSYSPEKKSPAGAGLAKAGFGVRLGDLGRPVRGAVARYRNASAAVASRAPWFYTLGSPMGLGSGGPGERGRRLAQRHRYRRRAGCP